MADTFFSKQGMKLIAGSNGGPVASAQSSFSKPLPIYLCAEISHTQGAAEYGLLSLLTLAVRARKELGDSVKLWVVLPTSTYGTPAKPYKLFLGELFTLRSFHVLAKSAGFFFFEDVHNDFEAWRKRSDQLCSKNAFDIRIGAVATSNLPSEMTPSFALAPNFTRTHAEHSSLTRFMNQTWIYLRDAAERNRNREALRVCLTVQQFWAGPLDHAAGVYPQEAKQVARLLEVAPSIVPGNARLPGGALLAGATEAAAGCAYAFFSREQTFTRQHRIDGSGEEWTPPEFFANASRTVVSLSRSMGLACAVINAVVLPPVATSAIASAFLGIDASFQVVYATKPNETFKTTSGTHSAVRRNLRERYLAMSSPLLITTSGTHWSDVMLYQRSLANRPSAVLADPERDQHARPRQSTPLPPVLLCASGSCADDCSFIRGMCINRSVFEYGTDFGDALLMAAHGGRARIATLEAETTGTLNIMLRGSF